MSRHVTGAAPIHSSCHSKAHSLASRDALEVRAVHAGMRVCAAAACRGAWPHTHAVAHAATGWGRCSAQLLPIPITVWHGVLAFHTCTHTHSLLPPSQIISQMMRGATPWMHAHYCPAAPCCAILGGDAQPPGTRLSACSPCMQSVGKQAVTIVADRPVHEKGRLLPLRCASPLPSAHTHARTRLLHCCTQQCLEPIPSPIIPCIIM